MLRICFQRFSVLRMLMIEMWWIIEMCVCVKAVIGQMNGSTVYNNSIGDVQLWPSVLYLPNYEVGCMKWLPASLKRAYFPNSAVLATEFPIQVTPCSCQKPSTQSYTVQTPKPPDTWIWLTLETIIISQQCYFLAKNANNQWQARLPEQWYLHD